MKKIKLKFLKVLLTYLNKLLLKITEPIAVIENYQSLIATIYWKAIQQFSYI